jgi:hypothetical protein
LSADFRADRNYQPPAHLELLLERFWDSGTASCDHDCIVGRVLWPALGAVGMQHMHIVTAQLGKRDGRLFGQLSDPFDRIDIRRNFGENLGPRPR